MIELRENSITTAAIATYTEEVMIFTEGEKIETMVKRGEKRIRQ